MSSSDSTASTRRWRIDVAYDGSHFSGFADQPGHLTVAGVLREALQRTVRLADMPLLVGAGRTDAGVHAFAQVIHVDLPDPVFRDDRGPESERLARSLNRQLAGRIVVRRARVMDDEFHARFSATWRAYRYLLVDSPDPALDVVSHLAWTTPGPFDLDLMNEAASSLVGTHDFRAFCRRRAGTTRDEPLVRTVTSARWRPISDEANLGVGDAPILRFDVVATAFCHQMVRSIVAAVVEIGRGHAPVSLVAERLLSHRRDRMASPAPPGGLALIAVGFDELAGGPSGFVS